MTKPTPQEMIEKMIEAIVNGGNAWAIIGNFVTEADYEGQTFVATWCVGVFFDPFEAQAKLNAIEEHLVNLVQHLKGWSLQGLPHGGRGRVGRNYGDETVCAPEDEPLLVEDPRAIIAFRTPAWEMQFGDDRFFAYDIVATDVLGHARGPR